MDILNAGDDEAANRIAVAISFGVSGGDPEKYSGTPAWSSLPFSFYNLFIICIFVCFVLIFLNVPNPTVMTYATV